METNGFFHCVLKELTKKDKGKDFRHGEQKNHLTDSQLQRPDGWDPVSVDLSDSVLILFKSGVIGSQIILALGNISYLLTSIQ